MKNSRLPSKAEIVEFWKDSKEYLILDWDEPSCWACGEFWNGRYDLDLGQLGAGSEVRKRIWNSVPLQRCHIVPKSLGGIDSPDNLFLLCRDCHDLAPNTKSKNLFLLWARNQSNRKFREIQLAIDSFELSKEDCEEMNQHMLSNEFREWLKENAGLHWNQKGLGNRLTHSTFVAALIEFTRMQKNSSPSLWH